MYIKNFAVFPKFKKNGKLDKKRWMIMTEGDAEFIGELEFLAHKINDKINKEDKKND